MKHYLSAETLGIEEWERDGLIMTMRRLYILPNFGSVGEANESEEVCFFDIGQAAAKYDCGTVACIGGWNYLLTHGMNEIAGADDYVDSILITDNEDHPLSALYYPGNIKWEKINNFVAAAAVEHFLETGKVDWKYALANA